MLERNNLITVIHRTLAGKIKYRILLRTLYRATTSYSAARALLIAGVLSHRSRAMTSKRIINLLIHEYFRFSRAIARCSFSWEGKCPDDRVIFHRLASVPISRQTNFATVTRGKNRGALKSTKKIVIECAHLFNYLCNFKFFRAQINFCNMWGLLFRMKRKS